MTPETPVAFPQPEFSLTSPVATPVYDLCIVDGSYLIHRILYASGAKGDPPFSEMMTSMGVPTGAIYGCLKTLRSSINLPDFVTKDLLVVWDGRPRGLSPRRTLLYPEYKAHTPDPKATPEDLQQSERHRSLLEEQRPKLCQILGLLGVPSIDLPRREGDDIIALAVRDLLRANAVKKIVVMSDDRDYYQLVSDNVHVYRAGIKEPTLVNPENFQAKVKIKEPIRYLLCAAISGDGSDNIDGIPKVGGTTAERIANEVDLDGSGFFSSRAIESACQRLMISDSRNRGRYAKVVENISIVARNLVLMDLSLESWGGFETELFWTEYSRFRVVQDRNVMQEFQSLEFRSYLDNFTDWVLPFRKLQRSGPAA